MSNVIYTKDHSGKDILLQNNNFQVMMHWEEPYMQACIDKLKPYGRVLEVGFGMALSATHIQTYEDVEEHTIIECDPIVQQKASSFLEKYPKAKIEKGAWQDVLSGLGEFDCVFFDDAPNGPNRFRSGHEFIQDVLLNHSHIGTRIVFYSEVILEINTDYVSYDVDEFPVEIPNHCRYIKKENQKKKVRTDLDMTQYL